MLGASLLTPGPVASVPGRPFQKGDTAVDSKQFDELVARLAKGPSRRDALKGIAGGALAAVGVSAVAEAKNTKKKSRAGIEGCIQTGKKCPSKKPRGRKGRGKKNAKNLTCEQCCQGATTTGNNGQTICACKPTGVGTASSCTPQTAYQCCSGICGSATATVVATRNRCVDYA